MIMGDICTRSCRFCAVATAVKGRPLEADEGERIADAAEKLRLSYVVLTSVDRDDIDDRGAAHFASCITAIKKRLPGVKVEALIPDYTALELPPLLDSRPDVIAHNVETVRRLQTVRDARASFDKSLASLRALKDHSRPGLLSKSSLMLGLGETHDEVLETMDILRDAGVALLVMGQYLQPSPQQIAVQEYVHPDVFARYKEEALSRGFVSVVSAPLARTSYHAKEAFGG
jgi:lipoic acid synthetase